MGKFASSVGVWIAAHRKTIAAVVAPVVVVVDTLVTNGQINWPVAIGAVLAALGVYAVPNTPSAASKA